MNLGYQLFSALAGTLADAKLDGSSLAVVLVQEYVTDLTDDAKHCRNAGSFDQFLNRLIGPDAERTVTTDGWVTKPVPVAGDGTWCREQTDIAFAKLVRHLRRPRSPSSPTG